MSRKKIGKAITHRIEIKCPNIMPHYAKVKLDGKDITKCIKRVVLDMDADKANQVVLYVVPSDVKIDVKSYVKIEKGRIRMVGDKNE